MRYEANAVQLCLALTNILNHWKRTREGTGSQMAEVYLTETKSLMERLPQLAADAQTAAKGDKDLGDVGQLIAKIAPKLARVSGG